MARGHAKVQALKKRQAQAHEDDDEVMAAEGEGLDADVDVDVDGNGNGGDDDDDDDQAFVRSDGDGNAVVPELELAADLTPPRRVVRFGVDFLPYVGTSSAMRGREIRRFSLNVVGGVTGGVRGAEIAGGFNIDRLFMHGIQAAGLFNLVQGPVHGGQLAGGANITEGELRGVQAAGGMNILRGPLHGAQLAGGVNLLAGEMEIGFMAAGGLNIARLGVRGVQAAGGANFARGGVHGAQLAGGLNLSIDGVNGIQIAGGLNFAGGSGVRGAQIAPVNFSTSDVKGVQVGVVNIARDSSASIGILNILFAGRWEADLACAETLHATLTVRNGGRYSHSLYSVGVIGNPDDEKEPRIYSVGYGFGGHLPLGESWAIDADALARALLRPRGTEEEMVSAGFLGSVRALLDWQILGRVGVFAGPTYNVLVSQDLALSGASFQRADVGESCRNGNCDGEHEATAYFWPGFEAGVRVALH